MGTTHGFGWKTGLFQQIIQRSLILDHSHIFCKPCWRNVRELYDPQPQPARPSQFKGHMKKRYGQQLSRCFSRVFGGARRLFLLSWIDITGGSLRCLDTWLCNRVCLSVCPFIQTFLRYGLTTGRYARQIWHLLFHFTTVLRSQCGGCWCWCWWWWWCKKAKSHYQVLAKKVLAKKPKATSRY